MKGGRRRSKELHSYKKKANEQHANLEQPPFARHPQAAALRTALFDFKVNCCSEAKQQAAIKHEDWLTSLRHSSERMDDHHPPPPPCCGAGTVEASSFSKGCGDVGWSCCAERRWRRRSVTNSQKRRNSGRTNLHLQPKVVVCSIGRSTVTGRRVAIQILFSLIDPAATKTFYKRALKQEIVSSQTVFGMNANQERDRKRDRRVCTPNANFGRSALARLQPVGKEK
jgi:hypothetical protein